MLALVLDIDHTIAHCILYTPDLDLNLSNVIHNTNVELIQNQYLVNADRVLSTNPGQYVDASNATTFVYLENNVHVIDVKEKNNTFVKYVVKFRPYLLNFLSIISRFYEITLYTNGTR